MVMNVRRPNSVFAVLIALLAGAGLGYLVPRCVAGWTEGKWMPLTFDSGMEVSTDTSNAVIPHAPGFVRRRGCSMSGQARFFPLANGKSNAVQLGYVVNITCPAETIVGCPAVQTQSTYRVQFGFTLMDADGFQLRYVRGGYHLLSPDESYSFRGFVNQPFPQDLANRVRRVDCRLCFEGIEVP
jgi:hypothetical protein